MILLIGHMRSGSTALSSVLCAHPAVSGYGETHVTHGQSWSCGAVVLNQWRRKAWRPTAHYLFDKVLHNRYDADAADAYASGHVIVLAREPVKSVLSIRNLADTLSLDSWRTDEAAADYYEARMSRLLELFACCPPERRFALTHHDLTSEPEVVLTRITDLLGLDPPLTNAYRGTAASYRPGGGDPLVAGSQSSIVEGGKVSSLSAEPRSIAVSPSRLAALETVYEDFRRVCSV